MPKIFLQGGGHVSALEVRESGMALSFTNWEANWTCAAESMMLEFSESGHPVFRGTSP